MSNILNLDLDLNGLTPDQGVALADFVTAMTSEGKTVEAPAKKSRPSRSKAAIAERVEKKDEAPAETQEVKTAPKEEAPAEETDGDDAITAETLRALMSKKVTQHRDAIKDKLDAFDAPNIGKLAEEKYPEMQKFLLELKDE